jgi:enoyl-CoA hydratase/carnithine racemase
MSRRALSSAASSSLPSVLIKAVKNAQIVTFNRPKALNALNLEMIEILRPRLDAWNADPDGPVGIVFRGAGGKAFCAGGDIKWLHDNGMDDKTRHKCGDFFAEEYELNHALGTSRTPVVSVLDGIVMGGGVGLSVHGRVRVATENCLFAMPETGIGFFPDVGGSHFLSRLDGGLGMFLGLTGARLRGVDALRAGVATHFVAESEKEAMIEAVAAADDAPGVLAAVQRFADAPASAELAAAPSMLSMHHAEIDAVFSDEGGLAGMLGRLEAAADEEAARGLEKGAGWAVSARKMAASAAPASLAVTHRLISEGASMSLSECLAMELRAAKRFMRGKDFFEGVGSVLRIGGRSTRPVWEHASVGEVSEATVEEYFRSDEEERTGPSRM